MGDVQDTFGSFAVLWENGINVQVAAGKRNGGGSYGFGKLGYIADWWQVGSTALAVGYYDGSDFNRDGSDSDAYGVGLVQYFDEIGLQAYATYRVYSYADSVAAYKNLSALAFGARWQF